MSSEIKDMVIMVVDDTPADLKLLTEILKEHDYKVCPIPSSKQAVAAAKVSLPDLILLDIVSINSNRLNIQQFKFPSTFDLLYSSCTI